MKARLTVDGWYNQEITYKKSLEVEEIEDDI